jgi:hypothetical protein
MVPIGSLSPLLGSGLFLVLAPFFPVLPGELKASPEYVILEDFNFTRGRLYPRYKLPQLDLYLGYLLNLLTLIRMTKDEKVLAIFKGLLL